MTLSKQLVALVVALLLMVFAGTFLISVHNTRDYLQHQMESHAQDAATSLGLSVSSYLADGDIATVTSMTDAIFDRGYYRSIRVEDINGKSLVDRILPVKIEGVPDWFTASLPLETPEGESTLMSGWVQAGKVRVMSHPGFAYNQLWQTALGTFRWFLFSAAVVLFIGILMLKRVLRPLRQVEEQANAICNREFPVLEKLPRTRDLRKIVEAMNRMSAKVRQMLDELENLASGLRQKAYQHPVTGLANKTYFLDTLSHLVESKESFQQGAIYLVQLKEFRAYNEKNGYQAGDDLLKGVASILAQSVEMLPKHQIAHLAGADFAVLVEDCSQAEAEALGGRLAAAIVGLYGAGVIEEPDAGHVGIAYFDGSQAVSELLAQADMALRAAQTKGANEWSRYQPPEQGDRQARGASEWRSFMGEALERGKIRLQFQPVVTVDDRKLMHQEVFVRLPEDLDDDSSALMTAGVFMPQAESLGITAEIDRVVIGQVFELLKKSENLEKVYAVNISPPSLKDRSFIPWLGQMLDTHSAVANRVAFEMAEYGAVSLFDEVSQLVSVIDRSGAAFALDHFGRSFNSLTYLRAFKTTYLKIDGSFMRSLEEGSDNRFFVQALADIAHGLEIKVIAEAVESEALWGQMQSLSLDGGQGYYIGRPK